MALKYGSSSKSSTFKRSAFPMQSGTTSHASAVKQADDLKIQENLKTQEELDKENKLLVAKETLAQNKVTAKKNQEVREKAATKDELKAHKKKWGKKEGLYDTTTKEFEGLSESSKARALKKNEKKIKKRKTKKDAADAADAAHFDKERSRGTTKGQVKKQGKLDRIQGRADKTAYKKYSKSLSQTSQGDMSFEQWKKSDKYSPGELSKREKRLTKEVGMTPEEYEANQARKKGEFFEGLDQLGQTISRAYGPGGTGTMTRARSEMSIEKDAAKSQDILDRTREMNLKRHEDEINNLENPTELDVVNPTAGSADHVNMDEPYKTQAQISEERIAAEKEKNE
jgi:hypothetical protein